MGSVEIRVRNNVFIMIGQMFSKCNIRVDI